jgi:hypothetical protein
MSTIQEKKQLLIDWETKRCAEIIKRITEQPDVEIDGIFIAAPWGEVSLWADVKGVDELHELLHKLRLQIGEYKLESYWVPYDGKVMTRYTFGETCVKIGIETTEENAVIKHLSNGKCKVEHELTKRVVCGL